MTQGIVDRFEPVEIDHHEGTARAPLRGVAHGIAQRLGQHHAVGQASERIVARHVRDLVRAFALLGDIGADPAKAIEIAVVVKLGRARKLPPALFALDADPHQQIGKTLAPLQPVGKVMQAGGELASLPGRSGNQFDERPAIDLVSLQPQSKGEAGRDCANPARGIDLPQPVRLALFKLA